MVGFGLFFPSTAQKGDAREVKNRSETVTKLPWHHSCEQNACHWFLSHQRLSKSTARQNAALQFKWYNVKERDLQWGRRGWWNDQLSPFLSLPSFSSVESNDVTAYALIKNMLVADSHWNILMFNIRTCNRTSELVQIIVQMGNFCSYFSGTLFC